MLKNVNLEQILIVVVIFISGTLIGAGIGYALNPQKDASHSNGTARATAEHIEDHLGLEIDTSLPVPQVSLVSVADSMGGYNINLKTTNFTFTPDQVGKDPVANTGHAHIYINNVKYARVYGDWVNIPASALNTGDNQIEVTLNANNHAEWTNNKEHIGAKTTLTK